MLSAKNSNRHNDSSAKTVHSECGDVELAILKGRNGEFDPVSSKNIRKTSRGSKSRLFPFRYVPYKDAEKITAALNPFCTAASVATVREELERFEQSWGEKDSLIVRSWQNNWAEIATFFNLSARNPQDHLYDQCN